ncbi:MAG: ATP-binding protein [Kiloniellales bacterium]
MIALSLVVAAGAWGLRTIVLRSFERLEIANAELDLRRFANAIDQDVQLLRSDLVKAVAEMESARQPSEPGLAPLESAVFENNRLNIACAYDTLGALAWSDGYDPSGGLFQSIIPHAFCNLPGGHPLMRLVLNGDSIAGLYDSGGTPFVIAAAAVHSPSESDSRSGTLLVARHLNDEVLGSTNDRMEVSVDFWSMQTPNLKILEAAAGAALSLGAPTIINSHDANVLQVYWAFEDVLGQPAFLARANIFRDLLEIGDETVVLSVVAMLGVGLAAILMSVLLVRTLMVGPLSRLTYHILDIRQKGVSGTHLRFKSRDEIGTLAEEFDKLLSELSSTTQQLADASYRAGRAEITEGILHNIGNTLNSLLASAHAMREKVSSAGLIRLSQAAKELNEGSNPLERQNKLAQFATLAAEEEARRIDTLGADVDRVISHVGRIEEILESQRRLGSDADLVTEANIVPMIESAIRALPDGFARILEIRVDDRMASLPPVICIRAVVHQIVANLLVNAMDSIIKAGRPDGRVEISAEAFDLDSRPMLDISIADNGVGLTEQEQIKVFQRHYTTKAGRGHGIGLHWSANVVTSMRGRLYVRSPGRGKGAVLHLVLPIIGSRDPR